MINTWEIFLVIGGSIIFTANVVYAVVQLIKYLKHGKRNADVYFEKKVRKIADEMIKEESIKITEAREREFKFMQEFISSELKPINENINIIKTTTKYLNTAALTDLKIKLRSLYHDSFEINGVLTKIEKNNWDKWFSDYTNLGGNGDVKTMDNHIQKIHLEITIEKQKEKANQKRLKTVKGE